MRVISQWGTVDIDYESSIFITDIAEKEDTGEDAYVVIAYPRRDDVNYVMASYSTAEKAKKALKEMSNRYMRYLVTNKDNYLIMTENIDCKLDTPFEHIDIKEFKTAVYQFPKEEDIYE